MLLLIMMMGLMFTLFIIIWEAFKYRILKIALGVPLAALLSHLLAIALF